MAVGAGPMPHPILGTTKDYCRNAKALLVPYLGASTVGGID